MSADWVTALGHAVRSDAIQRTLQLLIDEGVEPERAGLTLPVIVREIEHDQPERAINYMRSLVGKDHETFVIRALATLCADEAPEPIRRAETMPCPACGELKLRIEMRWEVPNASFSLAGAQMKVPVTQWPYLVCDGCGVEARGH